MKNFVILKNEQLLGIMDIGELTDLYYQNEAFKKRVDNKEIIIYERNDKSIIAGIEFQQQLNELGKKIKKYYNKYEK